MTIFAVGPGLCRFRVLPGIGLAVWLILIALGGCKEDEETVKEKPAPKPSAKFVYVTNNGDNTVSGYKLGSSGKLTTLKTSPFTVGTGPKPIAAHPNGDYLYVGNVGPDPITGFVADTITGFEIDKTTGELNEVPGSPVSACSLPTADLPATTVDAPVALAMGKEGEFLYVACSPPANKVLVFSIDAGSGYLSLVQTSPASFVGPVAMSLDGEYLAVAGTDGISGTISLLAVIEDGGGLSEVIESPFPGAVNPKSVAIAPDGKYVYASDDDPDANPDDTANQIYGHKVDPDTGALTAISVTPLAQDTSPFGIKVSPDSGFVYVTETNGSLIYGYKIGAGGALTALSTPSLATGTSPHGLAVGGTSGKYVYTADTGGTVSGFKRSTSTGELKSMTSSPFVAGTQPWDVVIVNVLK